MSSNAPGSFLGYVLQIPRALFHLLRAGPGDVVCVEFLGDVATIMHGNHMIAEEDKSSTSKNPLTNKSTDLWKAFYNWIMAINANNIDAHKTIFIIYATKSGRCGIVNDFHSATTTEEVRSAISKAKKELKHVSHDHDIWKYYNYVMNQNEDHLTEVIQKFELQIGSGTGFDEVREELIRKHLPPSQIQFIMDNISGWLQKELTKCIAAKQPARIEWEYFDKQIRVLFDRARRLELIDFTLQDPIKDNDIKQHVRIRPCYLKQLDAIGCDDDDILTAVTDYLRARVNRYKWIENEIINENVADDFQRRLIAFWKNQKKRIELTENTSNENHRGKLLLLDCKNRQETIRDMHPPSATVAGTYHALANEPVLGWHPNWENLFKNSKDG